MKYQIPFWSIINKKASTIITCKILLCKQDGWGGVVCGGVWGVGGDNDDNKNNYNNNNNDNSDNDDDQS